MSAVTAPAPPVKVTTRSRRDQLLIVAMFMVVVLAAFYLLAWKPQSAALTRAHDERAAAEAQLASVSIPVVSGEASEAEAVAEAAAAAVLTAVPASIATADVLRQLDGLAIQTGVKLGDITLSQPAPLAADPSAAPPADVAAGATPGGPVALSLTINVSGDAAATAAFVAGLATLPRLVVVDQVTIQTTPADVAAGTPARQDVQVSARVFATGA